MKASDNKFPGVILNEAANDGSDFSNPDADYRRLFLGEDGALHLKDSAGAVTAVGGIADQGAFTYLDATEAAAPGTPASGKVRIYAKSDGRIYSKDDAGVEYGPFDEAGTGGGPLLYVDSLDLGATGDDFEDMSGWTSVGSGSATAETGLDYDDTALILETGRSTAKYWYKTAPDTDFTAYLTLYGVNTNSCMMGFAYVNTDGDGVGIAYRAGNFWHTNVDNWAYASSGAQAGATPTGWPNSSSPYAGAVVVLRLVRSSSTIYASVSYDGGVNWLAVANSAGPSGDKRFYIGEQYENGPVYMLVGRLTVVT